jgi:hypothetical protein
MNATIVLPDEELVRVEHPPALLSQRNCGYAGLDPSDFLRLLPAAQKDHVRVWCRGQLRLVRTADFVAWLTRQPPAPSLPANDGPLPAEQATKLDRVSGCAPVRSPKKPR